MKRILFYLVHPAKFHLFRYAINELKQNHTLDIIINSKDVFEDLLHSEGWDYYNLFPKGRNISSKPSVIKSALKFILTVIRLEKYLLFKKKYDLFITDDALVVNGWWRRIPSFIFNDNDLETIKINKILFYFAYKIICPASIELGKFNDKRLSFKGNKALAHLHPNYFKPQNDIIKLYGLEESNFCILRVSKINATHDIGNAGISNENISVFIEHFSKFSNVIISSERELPRKFQGYIFKGNPADFTNLIYHARLFFSDSATMATEAAVLGTPNILVNKLAKSLGVNKELHAYGLQYYYDNFSEGLIKAKEIFEKDKVKESFRLLATQFIQQCDDLNIFLTDTILNNTE